MPRITFDSFAVQVPRGWADITHTIEEATLPYTLARSDGVGALQFSIALYEAGQIPGPTPDVLREMLNDFSRNRGLGEPSAVTVEPGPPALAAGSFDWDESFLRIWYVSDGRSFALVSYTCAPDHAGPELRACEKIVRSIMFFPGLRQPTASK
jgi:hypothetical protein